MAGTLASKIVLIRMFPCGVTIRKELRVREPTKSVDTRQ